MVIVSGPGGVGKDTIVDRLVASHPSLRKSRSWTTRPPRPGEPDDAYTFVDRDRFMDHVDAGGFFEWAEFLGHLYGTPVPKADAPGDLVLVIEVQGAAQVLDKVPDAVMILVVAPSTAEHAARLRARGESEAQVKRRLEAGVREERIGRQLAHYVVVNGDLDGAVAEVEGILASHRRSPGEA